MVSGFGESGVPGGSCAVYSELRLKVPQQRFGVLQVGGVEALGEPVVDLPEHRARLVAFALTRQEPRKSSRGAEFERFSAEPLRDLDRSLRTTLRLQKLG